jgi:hydrogenase maturation protease
VGKPAGTVVELTKEQIPLYAGVKLSQHQITFQEVLGLANIRGKLPEHLHLIGIQPEDISVGLDLSQSISEKMPEVISRAERMIEQWQNEIAKENSSL